jgi:hypothetical protein
MRQETTEYWHPARGQWVGAKVAMREIRALARRLRRKGYVAAARYADEHPAHAAQARWADLIALDATSQEARHSS